MAKTVLDLNHIQARTYFLDEKNYCSIDLPKYITFQPLLDSLDKSLNNRPLSSLCDQINKPEDDECINYKLLSNKDSHYAWRPFEIINPAIYVDLAHFITEESNWNQIVARFKDYRNPRIVCCSIPTVKRYKKTRKGSQILAWWEGIEQESLKLSLTYSYVFDADITNCYGSIYTHSIAWALHGKTDARKDRSTKQLLGSKIDHRFQAMRYRQTNGIPQGNAISDLIAEIVLGYVDLLLADKIASHRPKISPNDYRILRYRDDYKIFTNKPDLGKTILRYVSGCLSDLGMHLNTSKTRESSDAVLASVKEDKVDELFIHPKEDNYSKWLLQIHATICKHPNSGKAVRQLNYFHHKLFARYEAKEKLKSYENPEVMLGIVVNIAVANPKYYNWSVSIISILLAYVAKYKRKQLASRIVRKFETIPNTGLLDIWLQRVTFPEDPTRKYAEKFCKLVTLGGYPGNGTIWSLEWLAEPVIKKIITETKIIDTAELARMTTVVDRTETDSFNEQPS